MPRREPPLIRETRKLIESTEHLKAELVAYQEAAEEMVSTLRPGAAASATIEMMERLKVAELRERVTAAIAHFEAARHSVRVELVAAAQEEGRHLSDVARALGVSRQLTSRLGIEARERNDSAG